MKESLVVNACIRYMFAAGHYVWRNNVGGFYDANKRFVRYGIKGAADIIGVLGGDSPNRGKLVCIECKSGKNKQQPSQIEFQQRIEEKGGIYILAYCVEDLIERLEKYETCV